MFDVDNIAASGSLTIHLCRHLFSQFNNFIILDSSVFNGFFFSKVVWNFEKTIMEGFSFWFIYKPPLILDVNLLNHLVNHIFILVIFENESLKFEFIFTVSHAYFILNAVAKTDKLAKRIRILDLPFTNIFSLLYNADFLIWPRNMINLLQVWIIHIFYFENEWAISLK